MPEEPIRIVCAADRQYFRYLPNLIASTLANNSRPVSFRILTHGISTTHRQTLAKLFDSADISFSELNANWLTGTTSRIYLSDMAFARLLMPSLVTWDRFIYLDIDVIVRGDLSELYDMDLRGAIIAAVAENAGINSGVMLVDAASWRNENIDRLAFNHARNTVDSDQETISFILKDRTKIIDTKWNLTITPLWQPSKYIDEGFLQNGTIVHYVTGFKPWNFGRLVLSRASLDLWDAYSRKASLPHDRKAELKVLFWQIATLVRWWLFRIRNLLRRT